MIKKIDISDYESELIILERIHYEVAGRENILNFMINNDDNDKPQYKKIWKEYLEYLKTYNSII